MQGYELLKMLIESTGLPPQSLEKELHRMLSARQLSPETLSLEDVRELLAQYLQDVLVEAKNTLAG